MVGLTDSLGSHRPRLNLPSIPVRRLLDQYIMLLVRKLFLTSALGLTPFPLTFFRLRFSFTESILAFVLQLVTACSTSFYLTQAISFSPLF